jgi:hypothetical protein
MKVKTVLCSLLPICILIFASLACGTTNAGTKVTSVPASGSDSGSDSGNDSAASGPTIYHVGDSVEVGTQTITLNDAKFVGKEVMATFTIQNNGSKELAISTIVQFSAKDSDGTKLDEDIFDCGSTIGGTIQVGDKTKGQVCYKDAGTDTVKIYYEADLFGEGAIVFEIKK